MCLDKQLDCLHSLQYALQFYILLYALRSELRKISSGAIVVILSGPPPFKNMNISVILAFKDTVVNQTCHFIKEGSL